MMPDGEGESDRKGQTVKFKFKRNKIIMHI